MLRSRDTATLLSSHLVVVVACLRAIPFLQTPFDVFSRRDDVGIAEVAPSSSSLLHVCLLCIHFLQLLHGSFMAEVVF